MDMNPKLIRLIVIVFVGLLGLYNIIQIIRGENVIIHIIGTVILIGIYVAYKFYEKNNDNDKF